MASIFKQQYTAKDPKTGKRIRKKSIHWYIEYKVQDGIRKRIKGFKDKSATLQLAAKLEKESELAQRGIVDRFKEHRRTPLCKHLEDLNAALLAKGDTARHAQVVFSRAKNVMNGCRFVFFDDVSASKVSQYLADLRTGGLSIRTSNGYLQACKQFFRWMVADGRIHENPLAHLQRLNAKLDVRRKRRSFEPDEMRYLLETTRAAKTRYKMDGYQRSLVYLFACESGLRANEIRTLQVSSFDFKHNTLTVIAGHSKHRREDVLSMRPETAALLQEFFQERNKLPNASAFNIPSRTADMIRADMTEARQKWLEQAKDSPEEYKRREESSFLKAETPDGILDFHCSRHTTGSLLAAAGVHPKTAQDIMRHSDINLTMSMYTHTLRGQVQTALGQLPDLSQPSKDSQKAKATGTDETNVTADSAYRPAYRKLTETPVSDKIGMSSLGTSGKLEGGTSNSCNSIDEGHLGTNCHRISSRNQPEQEGFEPPEPFGSMVFKTIALSRSATAP